MKVLPMNADKQNEISFQFPYSNSLYLVFLTAMIMKMLMETYDINP